MSTDVDEERARCMEISRTRGDFVCGDDGYYVYWPKGCGHGSLAPHHLRWLAAELDAMNAAHDVEVRAFFEDCNGAWRYVESE